MNEGRSSLAEVRRRAALARSRAARRCGDPGAADRLCAETGERLFDHLDPVRLEPRWVVDFAMQCGLAGPLSERFPASRILSCGYCPGSSGAGSSSRSRSIATSLLALPFAAESIDLVASNLGLLWFSDPGPVLREIRRVLRPGGLTAFTTLGPGTLAELRRSWELVDDHSHIIDFIDMHDIGDAMVKAGFADVVMDAER
ncbi:MAG: methyltransferase domain-containing protein, partial [bacterium]|nr:methyltransferase domain-containing protein [bacterium]